MDKQINQLGSGNRARRARPRMFQVGQVWSAVLVEGEERNTGFTFKLLEEGKYWCNETEEFRKCWLGRKLDVLPDPIAEDCAQCWWFDDLGVATDVDGSYRFLLIRKKKLSNA